MRACFEHDPEKLQTFPNKIMRHIKMFREPLRFNFKQTGSRACLGLLLAVLLPVLPATAHEIRPTIATADFTAGGRYDIKVVTNMEALLAGIGPQHADTNDSPSAAQYNELRALPPDQLKSRIEAFAPRWLAGFEVTFDGKKVTPRIASIEVPPVGDLALARLTTIVLTGTIPAGAQNFQWRYAAEFGSSVLRVKQAGSDKLVTSWLKNGATSPAIPLTGAAAKSTVQIFFEYLSLGYTHIVPYGLDHILFVLGLYLLSTHLRPLLIQVTAFTVAHSITLGLGLYGVVKVPPSIVEPLIALSIVYVAVENIITPKLTASRTVVVFLFGLLHGLGFAGVLHELGLPRADYITGLISFNIGVELGQLSVIAIAFFATGFWFRTRPWYRARIVIPASVVIAAVGLFWTVERVVA